MKRRMYNIILILIIGVFVTSCSSVKSMTKNVTSFMKREKAAKYNDIRATLVTTQGEINLYLYPEAAPVTVANFINLAKRGYYDNTKIHRAIDNFMVQGGDPSGIGTGNTGYFLPDEIVNWLDFFQPGMLAMANAGPETGSSQFFITVNPADWLNGVHTIFGECVSDSDYEKVKKLEVGDIIKEIKFTGDVDFFLALNREAIDYWNGILDKNYPNLKKYDIKNIDDFDGEIVKYKEELKNIYQKKEDTRGDSEWIVPKFIRKVEQVVTGVVE